MEGILVRLIKPLLYLTDYLSSSEDSDHDANGEGEFQLLESADGVYSRAGKANFRNEELLKTLSNAEKLLITLVRDE